MPRPAPKRNRNKGLPASANDATATEPTREQNHDSTNAPKSPAQAAERGSALDPRRNLRDQTPMTASYENAIESSPMGERQDTSSRPGTGSRPLTRSRGYSSTLSFAGRKGDTSSRIPGTPGFESSVLSNFRRRPRQQSILQMMQAEDGSSDLDDDNFLGGLSPEDESTPLHLARKSLQPRLAEQSPSESSLPSSGGSRKRKRASGQLQVPQSPLEVVEDPQSATPTPRHNDESENNTPRPPQFPEAFSQTMAPPASSPARASTQGRSPVATIRQATETNARARPYDSAHLSTAILQDRLLPRRRVRRHKNRAANDFELSSDESNGGHEAASGDDDELSYRPRRRTRRGQLGKPRPLANARDRSKLNNQSKVKSAKSSKAAAATYSHVRGSGGGDKENQQLALSSPSSSPLSSPPDSDASDSDATPEFQPTPRYTSAELRAAAKKFAEIDQWRLEFEDVSASETQGD